MLTSTELEPLQSGADILYYQVSPLEYASKKLAKRNENSYKVTFQSCYNACNTFELVGHLKSVYKKRYKVPQPDINTVGGYISVFPNSFIHYFRLQ